MAFRKFALRALDCASIHWLCDVTSLETTSPDQERTATADQQRARGCRYNSIGLFRKSSGGIEYNRFAINGAAGLRLATLPGLKAGVSRCICLCPGV
jgi:hypothetical protein